MIKASSGAAPAEPEVAAAPRPRRKRSCLGTAIVSFVDGGIFGAAIGSIIASAQAISGITGGTETIGSAIKHVLRSGSRSALSLGTALASYSGGVCSLEKARGKSDVVNPFLVGGILGAFGSVQRVEVHDGQHMRKVFAANPRAMLGGSVSSGLLCSLFWYIQQPSRKQQEQQELLLQQQEQLQQMQQQQQGAAALLAQLEKSGSSSSSSSGSSGSSGSSDGSDGSDGSGSVEPLVETPLSGQLSSSGLLPESGAVESILSGRKFAEPDLSPASLEAVEPRAPSAPLSTDAAMPSATTPEVLADPWASK